MRTRLPALRRQICLVGILSPVDLQDSLITPDLTVEPDWEAWNIDGDAITQLSEWGAAHETSNWVKLATKIDKALKSKTIDVLKDFIPDSPFPARTLVKALLSLVELGIVRHLVRHIACR